jgi:uncharacterized protein YfiM (DUF2279 family)
VNACLFVLCLSLADARRPDRLFGEDKLQHFFVSALTTSLAASAARAAGADRDQSLRIGVAAGLTIGIAKELHDRGRPNETASVLDLVWDAAGVGAATALIAQTR